MTQTPDCIALAPNRVGAVARLWALDGEPAAALAALQRAWGEPVEAAPRSLTVCHINDLHHQIDRIPALAEAVAGVRQGSEGPCLFVSAGDDHIGSAFDELFAHAAPGERSSPVYGMLAAAGLDLAGIGNHELDNGVATLAEAAKRDARFPLVCSNLHGPGAPWARALALECQGLRVGVLGVTTLTDTYLQTPADPDLRGDDPLSTLALWAPPLAQAVDVLLVLSHLGVEEPRADGQADDRAVAAWLDAHLDTPAMVIGAHSHHALNRRALAGENLRGRVPVGQAGHHGQYLGVMSLDWGAERASACLRDAPSADPGHMLWKVRDRYRGPLQTRLQQPLCKVEGDGLGPEAVVHERYTGECAAANLFTDAVHDALAATPFGPVDVAFFNGSGVAPLPLTGMTRVGDWYQVMRYADTVYVLTLSGEELMQLLRSNAARVVLPDERAGLDVSRYVGRGLLHHSRSLRYRIVTPNPGLPDCREARLHGQPIEAGRGYRVAINTLLANGREHWDGTALPHAAAAPVFDLKSRVMETGHDTSLPWRSLLLDRLMALQQVQTRTLKDGRMRMLGSVASVP